MPRKRANTVVTKMDLITGGTDYPPIQRPGYQGLRFERRTDYGVTLVFKNSESEFKRRIDWRSIESAEDILDIICSTYESGFKRGSDNLTI